MTDIEKLKALKEEQTKIGSKIYELTEQILNTSKFVRGDKVKFKGQEYLVFEAKLSTSFRNSYIVEYKLTNPRKNGNMPKKFIYGVLFAKEEDIELVEKEFFKNEEIS